MMGGLRGTKLVLVLGRMSSYSHRSSLPLCTLESHFSPTIWAMWVQDDVRLLGVSGSFACPSHCSLFLARDSHHASAPYFLPPSLLLLCLIE